ncbi:hypothetical protein [Comamonas sp. C24C]
MHSDNNNQDAESARLSEKFLLNLKRQRRQQNNRERLRHFMEKSRLGWILHPAPFDRYYQLFPIPTKLEAARARFVRRLSWFSLLRKRSERTYQLGLGGIVIAPLVAWLVLHSGTQYAKSFPLQLGFLFFSGLAYVLACALAFWRCPDLVKEVSEQKTNYDPDRLRHWRVLIEEEIYNLVTTIKYPIDLAFDEFQPGEYSKKARQLFLGGFVPYQSGFCAHGRYQLEKAIIACAHQQGIAVYEETSSHPRRLSPINDAGIRLGGREPYIVKLSIRQASKEEEDFYRERHAAQSPAGRPQNRTHHEIPPGSIIISWNPSGFQTKSEALADTPLAVQHIYGWHTLYEVIDIERLAEAIASWQGRQNLVSRLLVSSLYMAAILLFGAFLAMQSWVVAQAIRGAI